MNNGNYNLLRFYQVFTNIINIIFKGNLYIPKPIQESVDNFGQIINEDSFNKFKNLYASDSDVDGYGKIQTGLIRGSQIGTCCSHGRLS